MTIVCLISVQMPYISCCLVRSLKDMITTLDNYIASTVGVEEVQDAYLHCGSD